MALEYVEDLGLKLPPSAAEIAEEIGGFAWLNLIDQLPPAGTRIWRRCLYVPKRLPRGHPLRAMLGDATAERLREAFGGEILQPGSGVVALRRWIAQAANRVRQILRGSRRRSKCRRG